MFSDNNSVNAVLIRLAGNNRMDITNLSHSLYNSCSLQRGGGGCEMMMIGDGMGEEVAI